MTTQAEWLRAHGLDDLVATARATWAERAHLGDLAALTARSRVTEAEALARPRRPRRVPGGGVDLTRWTAAQPMTLSKPRASVDETPSSTTSARSGSSRSSPATMKSMPRSNSRS